MAIHDPTSILQVPLEKAVVLDFDFGLTEGSLQFEGRGKLFQTLRRFTRTLDNLAIPYAVSGDLAMFLHGYRRMTGQIELIVSNDNILHIHANLVELGVTRVSPVNASVRDSETQVKIVLHSASRMIFDCVGLNWPEPRTNAETIDGYRVLQLSALIELKLANELLAGSLIRETADVQDLIRILRLPLGIADQLHILVRSKYLQLWNSINVPPPLYVRPLSAPGCYGSLDDLDALLADCGISAELRRSMTQDGVMLRRRESGRVMLVTIDYDLAEKYDMHLEDEYLDIDAF